MSGHYDKPMDEVELPMRLLLRLRRKRRETYRKLMTAPPEKRQELHSQIGYIDYKQGKLKKDSDFKPTVMGFEGGGK